MSNDDRVELLEDRVDALQNVLEQLLEILSSADANNIKEVKSSISHLFTELPR